MATSKTERENNEEKRLIQGYSVLVCYMCVGCVCVCGVRVCVCEISFSPYSSGQELPNLMLEAFTFHGDPRVLALRP